MAVAKNKVRVEMLFDRELRAQIDTDRLLKGQTLTEWVHRAVRDKLDAQKTVKAMRT